MGGGGGGVEVDWVFCLFVCSFCFAFLVLLFFLLFVCLFVLGFSPAGLKVLGQCGKTEKNLTCLNLLFVCVCQSVGNK